ncbi:MAG: hypothetical protein EA341_11385 [Mongoliibacter sp.]|uniref:hypothetical protein n=1 Tax=Mongoliibacter sp. TaxID=2022438 RepID=UPI0012F22A14|nr:hypothetical protein [Mongoliibacter sp.]TVP48175.1 MAG: hypothetical protein EA341_11385 [Mongoliibacter sp.]
MSRRKSRFERIVQKSKKTQMNTNYYKYTNNLNPKTKLSRATFIFFRNAAFGCDTLSTACGKPVENAGRKVYHPKSIYLFQIHTGLSTFAERKPVGGKSPIGIEVP